MIGRDPNTVGPLVVIESPFAGDRVRNMRYLWEALRDSIDRGECPYASHAIYPQVLDDNDPHERDLGIVMGFAWAKHAEKVAIYTDLGISRGMDRARTVWDAVGKPIEYRQIKGWQ